jgi:hypothetical protein
MLISGLSVSILSSKLRCWCAEHSMTLGENLFHTVAYCHEIFDPLVFSSINTSQAPDSCLRIFYEFRFESVELFDRKL